MALQFSPYPDSSNYWRLDVIGILAILGETNIKLSANLILSSALCYLPRLLPAPQGLLNSKRIKHLPQEEGITVVGIESGNKTKGLNFFAALLHSDLLEAPRFQVSKVEIRPRKHDPSDAAIRRRPFGPVNAITAASCALSVALCFHAMALRDGTGFLAVLIMSLTSTMISAASHWKPSLPVRNAPRASDQIPRGDVVLRNANGAFLIVHCDEAIAQKLYFARSDCEYQMRDGSAKALGGFAGGIGIITAVILFSNCKWPLQVATAISYGVLNLLYWLAAICPPQWTWDFSDFYVLPSPSSPPVQRTNFTGALAAAIQYAETTKWIRKSEAAPESAAWDRWLERAQDNLNTGNEGWFQDKSAMFTGRAPADLSHFQGALTYDLDRAQDV